ncbi:alpha/beta fold hydrolase [Flavihumibacter petaseus]|uniref:alpha/beta fold hydrolase n=1 Tax=Flavihumibacter petaseus TaxID=549295 RepID=UPI00061D2B85|nr:alpha/beta hydrolase [Flavihumibacter petaseus]
MKNNFFPLSFFLLLFYLSSCNNSNTANTQSQGSTEPQLKSIFINGDSIHYIDMGKGDPVVFVHGALSDYRTWRNEIDTFAKTHRVISYSRRYAWPNQQTIIDSSKHSYASHVKDLVELIKALKLEPAHLVGHSSGAFIAMLTGMGHPELVRSLTLGEPPIVSLLPELNANRFWGPVAEAFINNEQEKAIKIFLAAGIDSTYFSRISPFDREIAMANPQELRAAAFGQDFKPNVTCKDLEKIKTPVLLLGGDKAFSDGSIFIKMEPCLSNKEKATLPTTHGLEIENPSEFNKVVLGFIDKY